MRRPIQIQLLLPMLTVVVLAIALASLGSAYVGGIRANRAQEESLRRVVATLPEGRFPLNEYVLRQMSGLSGAEFVLFNEHDNLETSTLPIGSGELEQLRNLRAVGVSGGLAQRPTITLAERVYLCERVAVPPRGTASAGTLIILYPKDRWSAAIRQAVYPAIVAGAIAALAVMLITTLLTHRFVQPIRQLCNKTAAIAKGDFQPVPLRSTDDEIHDLTVSINQMSEQLGHYEQQVRRHEQLRTLDRLGAGLAHQLRNAATGGRMAIELHQRECIVGPASESLDVALRQLRLMESYLQRFMALGRNQPLALKPVSLAAIVEDALALVRPSCTHAGISLDFVKPAQEYSVSVDADALQQLIVNLAVNAMEAAGCRSDCPPNITVTITPLDESRVAFNIEDTGYGPGADVVDKLFEPFVSGKPEGTGLGLYVARQIAEAHHGTINWRRCGETTRFTVDLPCMAP